MEGHGRSWVVKEGHGWSFPITILTFQVRKVMGGGGWWWVVVGVVACRIIVSAPVTTVPFLWILDLGFGSWIWDLYLGLGFGLDNNKTIAYLKKFSFGKSHPGLVQSNIASRSAFALTMILISSLISSMRSQLKSSTYQQTDDCILVFVSVRISS